MGWMASGRGGRGIALIVLGMAATVMAGCFSSRPPENAPPAVKQARALAKEGQAAYQAGDMDAAARFYASALEVHRSIDNQPGILRSLLNLAVVQHEAGNSADARESLAAMDRYRQLRNQSTPSELLDGESAGLLAEAAWLRAHMWIDEGQLAKARAELERARPKRTAGSAGRFFNLEARLCLEEGRGGPALEAALSAWAANRRTGDRQEMADSARYLGKASATLGKHEEALTWFGQALEVDQALARGRLIVEDLLGMSRAAEALGRTEQARACAERARSAAAAGGKR